MPYKKYLAELLGTFTLSFMVYMFVAVKGSEYTPLIASFTLGLFVYTIGNISGAHLNPAVTIALASINKISGRDAIAYLISQFLGGFAVLQISNFLMPPTVFLGGDTPTNLLGEAIGAFFLVFGVSSVVHGHVSKDASGLTIGGSLLLGIIISSRFSHGFLNPAVALGSNSLSSTYLLGPIIGAILAAWIYKFLNK